MDAERFDGIAKTLAMTSRRRVLRGLAGAVVAAPLLRLGHGRAVAQDAMASCGFVGERCTANGECCAGSVCREGRCVCRPGLASCTGRCIDLLASEQHCGRCGRPCEAGQLCARGRCVTGTGRCRAGDNFCPRSGRFICDRAQQCVCLTTMAGALRCGFAGTEGDCGNCVRDADCASFGRGAFCAQASAGACPCAPGEGLCIQPCPA